MDICKVKEITCSLIKARKLKVINLALELSGWANFEPNNVVKLHYYATQNYITYHIKMEQPNTCYAITVDYRSFAMGESCASVTKNTSVLTTNKDKK